MRWVAVAVLVTLACSVAADDLQRAQELAWAKQFVESEALYRRVLAATPSSREAQLGLARVLLWQARYAEAIAMFDRLDGVDALEGRATARYWRGDFRGAARDFERVLALDPRRELARRSLAEIASTAVPSQRLTVAATSDDQPLDAIRTELAATFFSDPQTRWTASIGRYAIDSTRDADGTYASVANETTVNTLTFSGSAGVFTFPDGDRGLIGHAGIRRGSLSLRVERQPEIASAPSVSTHVSSTSTTLRWSRDRDWIAVAEVSDRRYSDDNRGYAAVAYALVPLRRQGWTLWSGASVAGRDTEESRFTLEGRYDPYWTPDDLREARLVVSLERVLEQGSVKVHADGGYARDRGRAFDVPFPRRYRPWRAGVTGDIRLAGDFRIEAGFERSTTVDYRVTSFHAALVRRR
jgi:tetratricopeptide (TPR) repeat protein